MLAIYLYLHIQLSQVGMDAYGVSVLHRKCKSPEQHEIIYHFVLWKT